MSDGIFNNKEIVGSNEKDLILKTRGKVYINYGKKHIELLNSKGELNVNIPATIQTSDSIDNIEKTGFYLIEDTLYGHIGEITIEIGSVKEKTSNDWKQKQIEIGLRYKSIKEAEETLKNGVAIVDDRMYTIVNKKAKPMLSLNEDMIGIENLQYPKNGDIIYFNDDQWRLEPYLQTMETLNKRLEQIEQDIKLIKDKV